MNRIVSCMVFCRKVVNLIGLHFLQPPVQITRVCYISMVKEEPLARNLRIVKQMINLASIERAASPDHPMDLVALFEEKFGKIRSILLGDTGD